MKPKFSVRIDDFAILEEIEGAWQTDDFIALLTAMDFDGADTLAPDELREMCLMSLQDFEPAEAAALVLRHKLSGKLNNGQIDNVSNEMLDEKMWEEYVDMSLHEQMFAVGSLLFAAFPRIFPRPDAVEVSVAVRAENQPARHELRQGIAESLVVRMLADGMDENATLHRLFEDQLSGQVFPEAESLVWIVDAKATGDDSVRIDVISSGYWLDALRETRAYESSAYADE